MVLSSTFGALLLGLELLENVCLAAFYDERGLFYFYLVGALFLARWYVC